jgi:type I restriction enzyme S subunit
MSDELPAGWAAPAIQDVCSAVSKRGPSSNRPTFQYIDLGAIDNRSKAIAQATELHVETAPSRAKQVVKKGDVVFSNVRVYLENIALVPNELDGEVASTAFCVLRPKAGIEPRYLYHYVTSKSFIQAVSDLQRGNSPPSVQDGDVKSQRIPLAPTSEQKRIVSKIDELFSRIDEGERALEQVSKLVERYRQSVLKAAVTGELTREWREDRKAVGEPVESAKALLTRILTARREAWEQAELAKMKAKGTTPTNDNWKKKYREPPPPDASQLPTLPGGWVWGSIEQLCYLENGDRGPNYPSRAHYVGAGVPFITAGNIQDWKIDASRLNYITEERFAMLRAGQIKPGDLLFCLRGSLGKTVINTLERGAIASSLVILRPVFPLLSKFLLLYFQSPLASQEIEKYDNGTAQPNLAAGDLAKFAVPIPACAELALICDRAERAVDSAQRQLDVVLKVEGRAQALRQATLKTAFSGALIPQDLSDEPATLLLGRISADHRMEKSTQQRGRKKKSP